MRLHSSCEPITYQEALTNIHPDQHLIALVVLDLHIQWGISPAVQHPWAGKPMLSVDRTAQDFHRNRDVGAQFLSQQAVLGRIVQTEELVHQRLTRNTLPQ